MNTFGKIFRLTSFGESHGRGIGGIIDGCPAGLELNIELIQKDLSRRKPGQSKITTQRKEPDQVEFLSGVFEGKTTGASIGFQIRNTNQRSKDYAHNVDVYRPSHADYTYDQKYGLRDHRGGGRSSARETANWIVGGAIARQMMKNVAITAFTSSVGNIFIDKPYQELDFSQIEENIVRCPEPEIAAKMIEHISQIKKEGDTVGGTITCVIQNVPVGLG